MSPDTYRTAIAAELALLPAPKSVAVIEAGSTFDLAAQIAKADSVQKGSWIIEIPFIGEIFETLAKQTDVSVFHLDAVPGSLFATTEKLSPGCSRVVVANGAIGSFVTDASQSIPDLPKGTITKVLKTDEERYVLGVVLVPETKDSQGDIYSHEEVRSAAHAYMENAGALGKQHSEIVTGKLRILETYIAPSDFEADGETVAKGTWLMGIRVVDDDLWSGIKKGDFTGFSIGGFASRNPETTTETT